MYKTYLVYGIDLGLYKIGRSKNIKRRIRNLVSKNKTRITYMRSWPIDVENKLHGIYARKRVKGEWFNLSKEDVSDLLCNSNEVLLRKMEIEKFQEKINLPLSDEDIKQLSVRSRIFNYTLRQLLRSTSGKCDCELTDRIILRYNQMMDEKSERNVA